MQSIEHGAISAATQVAPDRTRDGQAPRGLAERGSDNATSARARDRYLALAASMASVPAAGLPSRHYAVAHVSIASVAAAANVSRGALYRIWPSQQDFWNELIEFTLANDNEAAALDAVPNAPTSTGDDTDAIGRAADDIQELLLVHPLPLLRAGVVSYPDHSSPTSALTKRRARHLAQLSRALNVGVNASKARCVEGATWSDLAAVFTALGNGLPINGRMSPAHELRFDSPAFDVNADAPRSLLGVAFAAINAALTEPDPHADAQARSLSPSRPMLAEVRPAVRGRRQHYLEMAAVLAIGGAGTTDDPSRVLGHVTIDGLSRAAGVTRRTLGKLWPDQAQFRLDLFSYLLARERDRVATAIGDTARHPNRAFVSPTSAFLELGERLHTQIVDHLDEVTFLAFAPQLHQPLLADRALLDQNRHLDASARQLIRLLTTLMRRPRPGISTRQVALALFTLTDGINCLMRTHRDAVSDAIVFHQQRHSLTALATAALLDHMTEQMNVHPRVSGLTALIS